MTAQVRLTEAHARPERLVDAAVKLEPADAADDAEWFKATSWQGGGSIVERHAKAGPGEWRTTEPIPVYGNWKATLRLHKGGAIVGLPVFLPEDKAIPAKEVPAEANMTREFVLRQEEPPARAEAGRARVPDTPPTSSCW